MTVLYLVLPLALLVASSAVGAFIWMVRSGQLDDVDTPPRRILFDETAARDIRTKEAHALPGARPSEPSAS